MGKSKHPKLMSKALDNIASFNTQRKAQGKALTAVIDAASSASKLATDTILVYTEKFGEMQDLVEEYCKLCTRIEELEEQGNDGKKKELDTLEKQADKLRADYNAKGKEVETASEKMRKARDDLKSACEKFEGINAI
jgi:ribosomal protein L44E